MRYISSFMNIKRNIERYCKAGAERLALRCAGVGVVLMLALLTSCSEHREKQRHEAAADSLINAAYQVRDYDRILALADLHEQAGSLDEVKACYWRGYAHSRLRNMRMAEMEWKNAVSLQIADKEALEYYSKSANRLVGLLYLKSDYQEAIRVALAAIDLLKAKDYTVNTDYANLLTFLGSCLLKLGHEGEAANNYMLAWQRYQQVTEANHDIADYASSIVGVVNIIDAYLQTANYREANDWTGHLDEMLQQYRLQSQAQESFVDKQWARLNLYKACALEGMGDKQEARKAYSTAMGTHYAKTGDGQIEAANYLIAAHRWAEAADMLQVLDAQLARYNMKMTMDNIRSYLLPKYLANAGAHRTDTALAVGTWICHALDSAILWQKRDDAAELATIYETQQKETEIVEQRVSMSNQRFLMTIVTMALVVLGFCLFIFIRHRAAMRLESAYHELEIANVRAEESSRMKSDFIQQISHEIRTPLNILSGFTQVLTMPGMKLDSSTLQDINRQITENTDRITGLVNKMLELSDAKSQTVIARTDQVQALQVAAEAAESSGIEACSHLNFRLQVSPKAENVVLTTNLHAASRALSLLLDNAIKFTAPPETGKHDNTSDVKQSVVLRLTVTPRLMFFSVEDTGIGIPHKEAERIFEEFVQLDEYYNGTGIGLTVARSLARRIGGDIVLDTAYIGGARFVMTLPMTAEEEE